MNADVREIYKFDIWFLYTDDTDKGRDLKKNHRSILN